VSPEARIRLSERRHRIRRTRRRVLATSLTTFAAAWGVIFFQLVGGHDPALSHSTKQVATQSDTQTQAQAPAPVTTSQS
jgi:hypothetical protein